MLKVGEDRQNRHISDSTGGEEKCDTDRLLQVWSNIIKNP